MTNMELFQAKLELQHVMVGSQFAGFEDQQSWRLVGAKWIAGKVNRVVFPRVLIGMEVAVLRAFSAAPGRVWFFRRIVNY